MVLTEYFARAANFQVVHGQIKAAAQFFHLLNGVQTLRSLFGEAVNFGHHQIRIGLMVAAAHAAAQLVQLRQTKLVGARNHNGVGRGHINARFNDGGAEQHVVALGHKIAHDFFQISLRHLAMGHCNASFGQYFFQFLTAVFNGLYFVVQEVNLAASFEFTQHRLSNHTHAFVANKGFDGQAALGCRGNHAQISNTL